MAKRLMVAGLQVCGRICIQEFKHKIGGSYYVLVYCPRCKAVSRTQKGNFLKGARCKCDYDHHQHQTPARRIRQRSRWRGYDKSSAERHMGKHKTF